MKRNIWHSVRRIDVLNLSIKTIKTKNLKGRLEIQTWQPGPLLILIYKWQDFAFVNHFKLDQNLTS